MTMRTPIAGVGGVVTLTIPPVREEESAELLLNYRLQMRVFAHN
jgi:hypothetical protein